MMQAVITCLKSLVDGYLCVWVPSICKSTYGVATVGQISAVAWTRKIVRCYLDFLLTGSHCVHNISIL